MSQNSYTLRLNMVNGQLRTIGVVNEKVLRAFLRLERENFIDHDYKDIAYIDDDLPFNGISPRRYIMEPGPLAKLLQLCSFKNTDKVLHIGANTGYATAIIASMVRKVVALESDGLLVERLKQAIASYYLGNVKIVQGDLSAGYKDGGSYDVIFIEGAVDKVPENLYEQLKYVGRLVVVEGNAYNGVAKTYVKSDSNISCRIEFNLNVKQLLGSCSEYDFY